jgi:hypothetical protein
MVVFLFSIARENKESMIREFSKNLETILGQDQKKIVGINVIIINSVKCHERHRIGIIRFTTQDKR